MGLVPHLFSLFIGSLRGLENLNIVGLYNALHAKVLDKVGTASPTSEKELLQEWEVSRCAASSRDAASKLFGEISANLVCVVGYGWLSPAWDDPFRSVPSKARARGRVNGADVEKHKVGRSFAGNLGGGWVFCKSKQLICVGVMADLVLL